MKLRNVSILGLLSLSFLLTSMLNAEHVNGYTKKDGTYVAPYDRTDKNETKTDNWSAKGNVNPNTGEKGTKDPYAPPPPKK